VTSAEIQYLILGFVAVCVVGLVIGGAVGVYRVAVARRRRLATSASALASPEPAVQTPLEPEPVVLAPPEPEVVEPPEPVVLPPPAPEPVITEPPEPEPVIPAPPEPEPAVVAPPEPRRVSLREGLRRSRAALVGRLDTLLKGRAALDAPLLDEIETLLFGADIGVRTADDLLEAARKAGSPDQVRVALERCALEILQAVPAADVPAGPADPGHPYVLLVVGVNGSGKTTSIGKLATRWIREGRRVLVGAADTFRAAAIDQLEVWAGRVGAEIVKGKPGGDPAAVAFDAVRVALERGIDAVIIDTAGRLHTQAGLMDELVKIARVVGKEVPDAPHEVVLVLDANTGQNAIRQAEEFSRAVDVTHILLAKLDGTAKGGVVLGIAQEVGLPVRYVGVGEGPDDLHDFEAEAFVQALFSPGDEADNAIR
jgi:fused signal recognition particle receptor